MKSLGVLPNSVNWGPISVLISIGSAYQMGLQPIMSVLTKIFFADEFSCCFHPLTYFHLCWAFFHSNTLQMWEWRSEKIKL
jgi:hypothetical protein